MATTPVRVPCTVPDLLAAVKQLPPAELREFQRQFTAWSGQNGEGEAELLATIRANSGLPAPEQRGFNRLRRKRQAGTLTASEAKRLQELWSRVEQMNAVRLEALGELARRRGTDVRTLMRQLGLPENNNAF
jgi:hypothetical protein